MRFRRQYHLRRSEGSTTRPQRLRPRLARPGTPCLHQRPRADRRTRTRRPFFERHRQKPHRFVGCPVPATYPTVAGSQPLRLRLCLSPCLCSCLCFQPRADRRRRRSQQVRLSNHWIPRQELHHAQRPAPQPELLIRRRRRHSRRSSYRLPLHQRWRPAHCPAQPPAPLPQHRHCHRRAPRARPHSHHRLQPPEPQLPRHHGPQRWPPRYLAPAPRQRHSPAETQSSATASSQTRCGDPAPTPGRVAP
jgi:hypothetical protein